MHCFGVIAELTAGIGVKNNPLYGVVIMLFTNSLLNARTSNPQNSTYLHPTLDAISKDPDVYSNVRLTFTILSSVDPGMQDMTTVVPTHDILGEPVSVIMLMVPHCRHHP